MEVDVANETWGFMSSGSDRSCSFLELENGPNSSRSDDEVSQYSDTSVVSSASKKSKKHVQFQADDNLELVYEIPPRGHYSSTEQTDSDTSDDEEDLASSSDSSSEPTESPQHPSPTRQKRFHPSAPSTTLDLPLSHPSVLRSSFYYNTMSPAKGSYSVSKSKDKVSSVVTKITGVIPFRSNVGAGDKGRHGVKVDKGVKRTNSRNSCNGDGDEKQTTTTSTRSRVKGARKRCNIKIVDVGKKNIILKRGKDISKTLRSVSPRSISGLAPRCNSTVPPHCCNSVSPRSNSSSNGTPNSKRYLNGRRSSLLQTPPPKRLPPARPKTSIYPPNKTSNSSTTFKDHIDVLVDDSLKNLTIGKVYTVDGFIFPQDPVDQIQLSESSTVDSNSQYQGDVSNSSVQRKRCLSWKMANASSHSPVLHTPCILPLWESVQSVSLVSKQSVKTKL